MKSLVLALFLVAAHPLLAQPASVPLASPKPAWSFSLNAVLRMRSTPMNAFNFRAIRYDVFIPYNSESNVQQPSAGLRPALHYGQWTLSYAPLLHYGPIHFREPNPPVPIGTGYTPSEHKKLLLDQELLASVALPTKRKMAPRRLSVGYGVLNSGERMYLRNGPYNGLIDMRIRSVVGGVGFEPFGERLSFWFGVNYLYNGLPNNRVDNMLAYTLSTEFRLFNTRPLGAKPF